MCDLACGVGIQRRARRLARCWGGASPSYPWSLFTKSVLQVDIIEGANDNGTNLVSLHTTANCTMPENRTQTGTTVTTDCWNATDSNAGCGVQSTEADSYGPAFNAAGGGWYAFERSQTGISVWHWGREVSLLNYIAEIIRNSPNLG